MREWSWVQKLIVERDWMSGLVPGMNRYPAEEYGHAGEMRVFNRRGIETRDGVREGFTREVEFAREPHTRHE